MGKKTYSRNLWILIFVGIFVAASIAGIRSYKDWKLLHDRKCQLEAQLAEFEKEKHRLQQEIRDLKNMDAIELKLRKERNLVRPGEIIYDFRKPVSTQDSSDDLEEIPK